MKNVSIRNITQCESTSNSTSAEKLAASIWSWSGPVNHLRRESHEYGILGKNSLTNAMVKNMNLVYVDVNKSLSWYEKDFSKA